MDFVQSVDPFRCRLWAHHDRLEEHVNEETCKDEIQSFQERGQLIPTLGRAVHDDPGIDYELIYGARRLFVARHIKCLIRIEVRELSDRDALVAMDVENRQRVDLSPYERGLSYASWLRSGLLSSQDDIAATLKISAAQVSRLLKLARLPAVIVNAFVDPREIRERWAIKLSEMLNDAEQRPRLIRAARILSSLAPRPSAQEGYRRLLGNTGTGRTATAPQNERRVRAPDGRLLFRVRRQQNAISLILPAGRVTDERLRQIESIVREILLNEAAEHASLSLGSPLSREA
jgi:ParB/RepB/Spo0J family partition protein